MATANASAFLRHLTRGMAAETLRNHSDQQLVERLLAGGDEAAFEAVVRRHGPMVYRVCWRVLQQVQDAEDALQATFLILAQRLHTVRRHASLASWLHGIAHRVALKARDRGATRRFHEQKAADRSPADESIGPEWLADLDAELQRLPERWRAPLVLCYLEGRTQEEAARQLGWSVRTLRRRLEEGREALGSRLSGRGVGWPAAMSAVLLSDSLAPATLAPALIGSTVEAGAGLLTGKAALTAVASAEVAALAKAVLASLSTFKLKVTLSALALLAASVVAAGGLLYQPQAGEPRPTRQAVEPAPAPIVVKDAASLVQVAWGADGKTVVTLGHTAEVVTLQASGHVLKLWDGKTGKLTRVLGEEKDTVSALVLSRDRKAAALSVTRLFDRDGGAAPRLSEAGAGAGGGGLPGGGTRPPETEVRLLDAGTWQVRSTFAALDLDAHLPIFALSPDAKRLAVGVSLIRRRPYPAPRSLPPGGLTLWDVGTQKPIAQKSRTGALMWRPPSCLAFSPDGGLIAAGTLDGTIHLLDGQTGEPLEGELSDHTQRVTAVAFSPDGKTLLSLSLDHTAKVWDVAEGKVRHTLKRNRICAAAFSPNGKRLATAGIFDHEKDGWRSEVLLWDAGTGELKQTLATGLSVAVVSLAFSPDGKTLAAAGGLGSDARVGGRTSGELWLIPLGR